MQCKLTWRSNICSDFEPRKLDWVLWFGKDVWISWHTWNWSKNHCRRKRCWRGKNVSCWSLDGWTDFLLSMRCSKFRDARNECLFFRSLWAAEKQRHYRSGFRDGWSSLHFSLWIETRVPCESKWGTSASEVAYWDSSCKSLGDCHVTTKLKLASSHLNLLYWMTWKSFRGQNFHVFFAVVLSSALY